MLKSLKKRGVDLGVTANQIELLNKVAPSRNTSFDEKLHQLGYQQLRPTAPEIFQVNLGYMCNQTCKHCHVDAGPDRKEIMDRDIMKLCLEKIAEWEIKTVDLTGGAPEMNPDFRWFVESLTSLGVQEVIVRSNLTIIRANPKYYDLPEFFKEHNVRVISSLPFFTERKTDSQRGTGVFQKSIEALNMLNKVGYGRVNDLILDLVYNPSGAFLPGDQSALESQYKKVLLEEHDVLFNQLFALTNLPVNRFLDYLIASGNFEDYMDKLITSFNPSAVENLMCRNTISVDYLGYVYDCDFNQMLEMKVDCESGTHLSSLDLKALGDRAIRTGQHCFGCTAGAGSSCQGTLTE